MKTKQKNAKKNRPNPFLHMLLWGSFSGTILAVLYYVFVSGLYGVKIPQLWHTLSEPVFWYLALIVGGSPSVLLGILEGLILWAVTRNAPLPFTRDAMQAQVRKIYMVIASSTTLLSIGLLLLFYPFLMSLYIPVPVLIPPPFIAGIAAAYAAHRYLFRLRLWSEKEYGSEKAKNIERLEDKLKNEEIELEDETSAKQAKL